MREIHFTASYDLTWRHASKNHISRQILAAWRHDHGNYISVRMLCFTFLNPVVIINDYHMLPIVTFRSENYNTARVTNYITNYICFFFAAETLLYKRLHTHHSLTNTSLHTILHHRETILPTCQLSFSLGWAITFFFTNALLLTMILTIVDIYSDNTLTCIYESLGLWLQVVYQGEVKRQKKTI